MSTGIPDDGTVTRADKKRAAYLALSSDVHKENLELLVFNGFAPASGLNITNAQNVKPPYPDIECDVDSERYYFELGEIVDEGFARNVKPAPKEVQDPQSGWISEEEPLIRILKNKAKKRYETKGAPVDLVLHYLDQLSFGPAEWLSRHESDVISALKPNGPFSRMWIYDGSDKSVVWSRDSK